MQYKNSRYKISLGTSHMQRQKNSGEVKATCNLKIAEEALYKVLVTCIKETAGKEFHKVQAAWNVKAPDKKIPQMQVTCNAKNARAENRMMKTTYILNKAM